MLSLDQIPDALTQPARPEKSFVRQQILASAFTRRGLFRAVAATGMAIGLASLDGISRLRRAEAVTTWGNCPNWHPLLAGIYGVPAGSSAYKFWTLEWNKCNPTHGSAAGNIGPGFCGSDGFHRNGVVGSIEYDRRPASCAGRNTWAWKRNGVEPEPPDVRCSDGRFRLLSSGSAWVNSTCKHPM
ncbi:hypothetical protein [Nocardioides soli]|uniref:Uncharacterized protein n=1 Tax=Nocardioides soli TaxID=1036020 RepID=A0A7W4VS81_9ACTN|nr:hypothetical protein [Nocardioides soli]MBB3040837.1 hypothetical protein [Nocardioides soli]